jgi:hypothetical protein
MFRFPALSLLAGVVLVGMAALAPLPAALVWAMWPLLLLLVLVSVQAEAERVWLSQLGRAGWSVEIDGIRLEGSRELISWPKVVSWVVRGDSAARRIRIQWFRKPRSSLAGALSIDLADPQGILEAALREHQSGRGLGNERASGAADTLKSDFGNLRWFWVVERRRGRVAALSTAAACLMGIGLTLVSASRAATVVEVVGPLPFQLWILGQAFFWGFVLLVTLRRQARFEGSPSLAWVSDGVLFGWNPKFVRPVLLGPLTVEKPASERASSGPPPYTGAQGRLPTPEGGSWPVDERPLLLWPTDDGELASYWRARAPGIRLAISPESM